MVANFALTKQGGGDVLLRDTVTADATLGVVSSLLVRINLNYTRDMATLLGYPAGNYIF